MNGRGSISQPENADETKRRLDGDRPTWGRWFRHWSTRLLPLSLWVLVYPYKGSAHFALARDNALLLDAVGDFDALEAHFQEIFGALGYDMQSLALEPTNVSDYKRPEGLIFTQMANLSLRLHAPKDLALYRLVREGVHWANRDNKPKRAGSSV